MPLSLVIYHPENSDSTVAYTMRVCLRHNSLNIGAHPPLSVSSGMAGALFGVEPRATGAIPVQEPGAAGPTTSPPAGVLR